MATVVKLDADKSLDAIREAFCKALVAAYPGIQSDDPNVASSPSVWVRELFPNYAIVDVGGKIYRIDFVMDGTSVVLGEKTEVVQTYKTAEAAIKVAESSVQEIKASQINKKGDKWDLQILHSGRTRTANKDLGTFDSSLSGRMAYRDYTAETIKDSVARDVWNGTPFVLRDRNDHLATANGNSRALGVQMRLLAPNEELSGVAGTISGNYVAETADGVAVRALLTLRNSAAGRAAKTALQRAESERQASGESSAPLIDVSWTGDAESELVTSPFISEPIIKVSRINEVTSVDPCLVGNAGGFIYQAAEAATKKTTMNKQEKDLLRKAAEAAEAAGEGEGGGADINTMVANAYLEDNPGVLAYAGSVEEFLKNPNAQELMSDWLTKELAEEDEEEPDEDDAAGGAEDDETPAVADTNKAAEAAASRHKIKGDAKGTKIKKIAKKAPAFAEKTVSNTAAESGSVLAELAALRKQVGSLTAESIDSQLNMKLAEAKLPAPLEKMVRNQIKNTSAESAISIMDSIIIEAKNTAAEMSGEYTGGAYKFGADEADKMSEGVMHMVFSTANAAERKLCAETYGKDYGDRKFRIFDGPKQMYLDFVGGRSLGHGFGSGAKGSVAESASAGELAMLVGDAMHRRMIMAYRTAEGWDDFTKISKFIPVNDFKAWHAQSLGYFMNPLSAISKGTDYPEIATSNPTTDSQDVLLTLVEQGGLFTINWVDMVNDNLEFFSKVPAELGKGSKKQLYKAVFDRLAAAYATNWQSTGYHEFSTNLGTAVSAAAISDAQVTLMATTLGGQTDLAGEVMGVTPRYLIYPQTQLQAAHIILMPGAGVLTAGNSIGINGAIVATAAQSLGLQGIAVKHWNNGTGTNYGVGAPYILAADQEDIEEINILCYQGNTEPQIVQEATATGLNFTAKAIRFRLEHHWKVGLVENRGFVASSIS